MDFIELLLSCIIYTTWYIYHKFYLPETTITLFLLTILLLILIYFFDSFKYWSRVIGIPEVSPIIPFGNIKKVFFQQQSFGEFCQDLYIDLKKRNHKYGGFYMFTKPMLCVVDPEVIKLVLMKDFQSFYNRGIYHDESFDPLSANLFALEGKKWRKLRKTFTPTFTSGKMKMMFQTLVECSNEIENILEEENGKAIDIKDLAARFTTDVIGSCAFGINCNSLKEPNVDFRIYGRKIFDLTPLQQIKNIFLLSTPKLMKYFKVSLFGKDISDFFQTTIQQTVEYREKNNIERNDFMNLLIKLKNNQNIDEILDEDSYSQITMDQLAAQAFIFFAAGFETSSSTMSFCLYELACNQEIQNKLKQEINKVLEKYGGVLTYEGAMEMNYMDKIINETLRKYPPLPMLNRQCTQEFHLPDSNAFIKKGTLIWIPVLGLHRDPNYYPDPEKFDPERFSEENKSKIPPFVYMPFGDGPRNCVGARFGLLQVKVGLTALLRNCSFELDPRTTVPLKFDGKNVILSAKDTIYLKCKQEK